MTRLESPQWDRFHAAPSDMPEPELRELMLDLRDRCMAVHNELRDISGSEDIGHLLRVRELDKYLDTCEASMRAVAAELTSRRRAG